MTTQEQLKLQAFLDGEVSAREAVQMRDLLSASAEASALAAELRNTSSALKANEVERTLPESREFFWSKIEREIQRQEAAQDRQPAPAASWLTWVRRHLLPVGSVALISGLLVMVAFYGRSKNPFAQMELASDDMGSYTYRDQANKMTMVWLYDRDTADVTATTATEMSDSAPTAMPE